MFHRNIRLPGVYIFNNTAGATPGMQGAPIFSTMASTSILGINDAEEKVLVFPKYRVIFYPGALDTATAKDIDNTTGTKWKYETSGGGASSCRVYYNNVEINEVFSATGN